MRAVSMAPWGAAALLWLPIAFAGGLGFAPLSFLMAIFFVFQRRALTLHPYMISLTASFVVVVVSSLWSPFEAPPVVFDLENGKFAIKATAIRVGLVALLSMLIIGAALKTPPDRARIITSWFLIVFMLHGLMMLLVGLFTEQALDLFAPLMDDRGEGYQNIGRNAVVFSLAGGALIAALRSGRLGLSGLALHVAALVSTAIIVFLEMMNDNIAGAVGVAAVLALIYLLDVFGAGFWRVLGGATALYILAAPVWTAGLIAVIGENKSQLPPSAWWRIESWSYAIDEIITRKPLFGWGLDAMRAFRDTFPDGRWEGQLMMPNHPHNMLLHIWAETGFVGASLAAATCFLLGWRLSDASSLTQDGGRAGVALWAVAAVVCSFSFSLWNEWWWALVGLSGAIAVLFDRAASTECEVGESI